MSEEIFEQLRARIDQYSVGFNRTESRVEIELLKKLFTPEEARMYLHLGKALQPVADIAQKACLPLDDAATMLVDMTQKGLTFPKTKDGTRYYAAAPFLHGFFENNAIMGADNPDFKELAELVARYFTGGFKAKGPMLRTIPINADPDADPGAPIVPLDDVKKIIAGKKKIGLFPCSCVVESRALGGQCDQTVDVCMGFDFYAEYLIDEIGVGRYITREEAIEVLKLAEDKGLVHQIGGDKRNVEAICNCCPDCCGSLAALKQMPEPTKAAVTNYFVHLDVDACTSCETCIDRCPMNAISAGEEIVYVDLKRCIGCGLCTATCPTEALSLKIKPEDQRQVFDPETYRFMRSSLDFYADLDKGEESSSEN